MIVKKKLIKNISLILTLTCILSSTVPAFAQSYKEDNYGLSNQAIEFLNMHKIDISIFKNINDQSNAQSNSSADTISYDEGILSLEKQAEAYNFNDNQIEKYIEGLVNTSTIILSSTSSTPYSTNRPNDNGIGYEVKSNSGYYQETAFVTLPTVNRDGVYGSSGYMFYTIANSSESYGIDVGLWYGYGSGGYGWRGFYTADGKQVAPNGLIDSLTAGSAVYLQAYVTTNNYIRCRVLDANDFSTVYYDCSYYVGSNISRSSAVIDRQITLCNDDADFSTGEYLNNAEFSDAYIYDTSGSYSKTLSTNTKSDYCGAFGTNNTTRDLVTVNDYSEWYYEDVSINFDLD